MMQIRPLVLQRELAACLTDIQNQIDEVNLEAVKMNIEAKQMRDTSGNYVLTPLLVGKAQCLHALVLLNEQRKGT